LVHLISVMTSLSVNADILGIPPAGHFVTWGQRRKDVITDELGQERPVDSHDCSTNNLINYYRQYALKK